MVPDGSATNGSEATPSPATQDQLCTAARLLGLPLATGDDLPSVGVAEAYVGTAEWRFVLQGTRLSRSVLIIEPRNDARRGMFRTAHLDLGHQGRDLEPLMQQVLKQLATRLARVTVKQLQGLLAPNPSLTRTGDTQAPLGGGLDSGGPDAAAPDSWPGLHRTWDHPDAWRHFFADQEQSQERSTAIRLVGPTATIYHGPFDCRFLCPRGFIRPPGGFGGGQSGGSSQLNLYTKIREIDVIGGGGDRLRQALSAAREDGNPAMIQVHASCVPQLVGDDVEAIVDEARERCSCPILVSGSKSDATPERYWVSMFRSLLEQAAPVEPQPRTYNLVGFWPGPDLDELAGVLDGLGFRRRGTAIPEVAMDSGAALSGAALNVLLPNRAWDELYRDALPRLGIPSITPTAPYGFEGTVAFLTGVAGALGEPGLAGRIRRDAAAWAEREWSPLVAQARGRRIGFVCSPVEVAKLRDPGWMHGIPMVEVLEEMGFEVHVAVAVAPEAAQGLPEAAMDWLGGRAGWAPVDSEPALRQWFGDLVPDLVYTDYFFDSRLVHAGIASFSMEIFERGFAGAARSLRRLLNRCRMRFYRDYHSFLEAR